MSLCVETVQGSVSPKGEVVVTTETVAAIIVHVEVSTSLQNFKANDEGFVFYK